MPRYKRVLLLQPSLSSLLAIAFHGVSYVFFSFFAAPFHCSHQPRVSLSFSLMLSYALSYAWGSRALSPLLHTFSARACGAPSFALYAPTRFSSLALSLSLVLVRGTRCSTTHVLPLATGEFRRDFSAEKCALERVHPRASHARTFKRLPRALFRVLIGIRACDLFFPRVFSLQRATRERGPFRGQIRSDFSAEKSVRKRGAARTRRERRAEEKPARKTRDRGAGRADGRGAQRYQETGE